MNWAKQVDRDGYGIVPAVVGESFVRDLLEQLSKSDLPRSRAGVRHLMRDRWVAQIAARDEMIGIAREILGAEAWPFRAPLFDKSPWSVKEGVNYAHAPSEALEQIVALRLHLDDSSENNGPLRVPPGTHWGGVLADEEVLHPARGDRSMECLVAQGGVVSKARDTRVVKATSEQLDGYYILNTLREDCGRTGVDGRLETKADSSLRSE